MHATILLGISLLATAYADDDAIAPGAERRLGSDRYRMQNPVGVLLFLDDERLLSAGADPDLYEWDVPAGTLRRRIPAVPGATVNHLEPIGDDVLCLTTVDGQAVDISLAESDRGDRDMTTVGLVPTPSHDGAIIATPNRREGGVVDVTDRSGELLQTLQTGGMRTMEMQFSPDDRSLAIISWKAENRRDRDGVVTVVPLDSPDAAKTSVVPGTMFTSVHFLGPERVLLGAADGTLRVLDVPNGVFGAAVPGHQGPVVCLATSADGLWIAAGGRDGRVSIHDGATGELFHSFLAHTSSVSALAFSPDGTLLASGGVDRIIRNWRPETGERVDEVTGHETALTAVAWSPAGDRVVTGAANGDLIFWSEDGRVIAARPGNLSAIHDLAFSADGETLAVVGRDGSLGWFRSRDGAQTQRVLVSPMALMGVDVAPDDATVAVVAADKTLRLLRPVSGEVVRETPLDGGTPFSVAFSPDGSRIATGTSIIQVWDRDSGDLVRRIDAPKAPVAALRFRADGRHLITGSADRSVTVWDLETGEPVRSFPPTSSRVSDVACSPDDRLIAVATSGDATVRIYDMESAALLRTLDGAHRDTVSAVSFGPDGRIVTGSDDTTAVIWSVTKVD